MRLFILLLSVIGFSYSALAQTYVGTFVTVKGDVKILRAPSSQSRGPFAQVEGIKYEFENARIGKKVNPGERIQSGADGKAKIAYPNGDHFIIGNGTVMVLPQVQANDDKKQNVDLLYGRVRALISKKGPRNNMIIKTPSAVAGVRGTDFFTRSNAIVGTQLTVLRGEVAVSSKDKPEKVASVKSGFMAELDKDSKKAEVIEAPKEELLMVQSETTMKATKEEIKSLNEEERIQIVELNKKSKESVMNEIKLEDPTLYQELKQNEKISTDDIHTAVVAKLYKTAPSDLKRQKPTTKELEDIGDDVYKKYFSPENTKTE
jgi:hypothetical protein